MAHASLDIYGLTRHRDEATIARFLDAYIDPAANEDRGDEDLLLEALPPAGEDPAGQPKYESEPAISLSHSLQRGLDYPRRSFTLYLEAKDPSLDRVILSFTNDDQLVVGLSILDDDPGEGPDRRARDLLNELAQRFDCHRGVVLLEEYPPDSEAAFRAKADLPLGTLYYAEFQAESPQS